MSRRVSRRAALQTLGTAAPGLVLAACGTAFASPRRGCLSLDQAPHPRGRITPFEEFAYRAPYMFGGRSVDRVTLLNVTCRIGLGDGKQAHGFGSMTLGNAWAFPAASQDVGLGHHEDARRGVSDADGGLRRDRPSAGSVPRARARLPARRRRRTGRRSARPCRSCARSSSRARSTPRCTMPTAKPLV